MKRIIAIFCMAALMACNLCAANAEGADVEFYVNDGYAHSGGTAVVSVGAFVNSGFAGFTLDIYYDSSLLTPTAVYTSELLDELFVGNISYGENSIRVVYAATYDVTVSGDLFYIEFQVYSTEDAAAEITVNKRFLCNAEDVSLTGTDAAGMVEIDADGWLPIEISCDEDDGCINAVFRNKSSEKMMTADIFIAQYDSEGNLLGIKKTENTFSEYGSNISCRVEILKGAAYMMGYVWNDALAPLANSAVLWEEAQ